MPLRLNLGGGPKSIPGFLNVDLCQGADVRHDLREPLPFPDGSVEEIMAIHVIESFHRPDFLRIVRDWARVLKGKFTCEFTDLELTCRMYLSSDPDEHLYGKWGLYGNQEVECPRCEYHTYVYTLAGLTEILRDAGFRDIQATHEGVEHDRRRDWRLTAYHD